MYDEAFDHTLVAKAAIIKVNKYTYEPTLVYRYEEPGNNMSGYRMAMEFNGDVYACDHWVEPEWLVGNIANSDFPTLATSEKMRAFDTKKQDLDDECWNCPFLRLCWGGCPKDRFITTDSGPSHNYLCQGYRRFYSHALPYFKAMAFLISRGVSADQIMDPAIAHSLGLTPPIKEDHGAH